MIDWRILETFSKSIDATWPASDKADRRSRDLVALSQLGQCNLAMTPALCFFAGRMVEVAVATEYSRHMSGHGSSKADHLPGLDEQINQLQQLGALGSLTAACIHEVRKLGNKVRHRATFPSEQEAAFCLAMLKGALPWMAGDSGGQVQKICDALDITKLDSEVRRLLNAATLANPSVGYAELLQTAPSLLYTLKKDQPAFPTAVTNWVTQQCIAAKRFDLAGELIAPFLLNHDADAPQLRPDKDDGYRVSHFNRLLALRLSRMGEAGAAVGFLTPLAIRARYLAADGDPVALRTSNSHTYAETLGILAGAHKSLWMAQHRPADLALMTRLYQRALDAEPWNSYLAINAAACAAWRGDLKTARGICVALLEHFELSRTVAEEKGAVNSVNIWDVLTHAEALLLNGQHALAIERYRDAHQAFGIPHAGDIRRAYIQVCIHAQHNAIDGATQASIAKALGVPASPGT